MNSLNDGWYGALKEAVQQQQSQLVWVSEGKVRPLHLCAGLGRGVDAFESLVFCSEQLQWGSWGRGNAWVFLIVRGVNGSFSDSKRFSHAAANSPSVLFLRRVLSF